MPQSLRRTMERQPASIMLSMGAAPAEVATQLARSAEPGDREAISALRQAAQSVGHSDASAAADLSRRALELLSAHDADRGSMVAETVGLLNRASRYAGRRGGRCGALGGGVAPRGSQDSAAPPDAQACTAARRGESPSAAIGRHQRGHPGPASGVAAYRVEATVGNGARRQRGCRGPASTGDLEATILADIALALLDDGEGYAGRALGRLEELCTRARASDVTAAHFPAALNYAFLLAMVGRLDDAAAQVADGIEQARREGNAMALDTWATIDGMVHLAAGRLSAARAATESLPRPEPTGVTPLDGTAW